ncbi:MAG: diguanylate cyclase [SAR324 cluster bacterium]|nr:diguanylate cyclase [SAR324 cluster bacterium]
MKRIPLFTDKPNPQLDNYVTVLSEGRYFKKFSHKLLKNIIRRGTLVKLKAEEHLIYQGDDSPPEMYVLLKGSLAVLANSKFILRLELPGDIAGELSVLNPSPRSAEVVAETDTEIIAFTQDVFAVDEQSETVPVFYLMFTYILAEKLRITTAQSLVRKNNRVISVDNTRIALIDENTTDRLIIRGILRSEWPEAKITDFDNVAAFIENSLQHDFDLFIIDPNFTSQQKLDEKQIKSIFNAMQLKNSPIIVTSKLCQDVLQRQKWMRMGANDLLTKPFSIFDFKHSVTKSKIMYHQQRELDRIEQDADTDRLTGLANRRRLDQFLEALQTVYPDNKKPFSLVISDVDNFKHYNDTHGHQMGDVVLAGVAGIFAKTVRKGDLAARFGGEEFVMILPDCQKTNAVQVAEKLRKAIENEEFPYQDQQPTGNLTVTLGVATFPQDADNIDTLLKKADECLYIGKESGRNITIAVE